MSSAVHDHGQEWPSSSLEAAVCPGCGASGGRERYSFAPFRVVECPGCRSAYLNPRPTEKELTRLYEQGYFSSDDSVSHGYANYASLEQGLRRTFERRYRLVRSLVRGGRAVDLGCAMGYALDCLRGDFEDRIGIDLAPEAIEEVCRRGHRGFCGTLEDAALESDSVSLFLSMDTIEHLHRPAAAIVEMARVLRPGGILMLVTPDYGSLLRRISGKNWVSFKIPEHVSYFSRDGMSRLLRAADLDVVRYATDIQYSPLGLVLDRGGKVLPKTAAAARTLLGPAGGLDRFVPVYNGMFVVVARKQGA